MTSSFIRKIIVFGIALSVSIFGLTLPAFAGSVDDCLNEVRSYSASGNAGTCTFVFDEKIPSGSGPWVGYVDYSFDADASWVSDKHAQQVSIFRADKATEGQDVTYDEKSLGIGGDSWMITRMSANYGWRLINHEWKMVLVGHSASGEALALIGGKCAFRVGGAVVTSAEGTEAEPDALNEVKEALTKFAGTLGSGLAPICGGAGVAQAQAVVSVPEVEALVEKRPTNDDLQIQPDEKTLPVVRMVRLDGSADFKLPDGTWIPAEEGDTLPFEGVLQTQYGSTAELHFSDGIIIFVGPLTELNIKEFNHDPNSYRTRLDLGSGEIRVKVLEGDFETDMWVSPPNSAASPVGTDFAVAYDANTGIAVYEVYDGSLRVISSLTNEQKTISSGYGQPIRRLEVVKDGAIIEQAAVPQSEWQARQIKPPDRQKGTVFIWILAVVVIAGVYVLHRVGKLQPIIRKALTLVWKKKV